MEWLKEVFFIYLLPFGLLMLLAQTNVAIEITIPLVMAVMFGSWAWLRKPWQK